MSKRKAIKTKKFRSLTVSLAIALLTLSAVVLLLFGSLDMYFNFQNQRRVIASQQQSIAQGAASTVKIFIQEKFTTLETALNISNLARARQEEQKLVLEKLLGLEPAFRQLVLLSVQGQELQQVSRLSKVASGKLTEQVESEILSELSQGKDYFSPVFIDEITSEPMVIIGVPVTNIFGDFKGTLIAEVNLKFMWDVVDNLKIGENGLAYVVDKHGNLIAFGDISRVLRGDSLIQLQEVNEFVNGDELTHESTANISKGIQGTYVVANHAHLGTPDWAVVVELPVLEAYETVTTALGLSVLVMLLGFVLAIVAGIYLSKRITNPIITLRDATRRIGKGNLDTKIEVQSKDEIGELAISFNQMIENLNKITVSRNSLKKEVRQRKRAEKRLQHYAAELERSNEEVKNFAYIVSHDLRIPLVNLKGYTSELRSALEVIGPTVDTALPHLTKEKQSAVAMALNKDVPEALEFISSSVSRMDSFINAVLQLSRLGRRELKPESIDMKALVQSSLETLSHQIQERGIKVTVGSLPQVVADRTAMEQIIDNVLGNAVKYLDPERPGQIEVTAETNNGEQLFHIQDNGCGIAQEEMHKVFTPFRRAGKQDTEGEGMGLAYVQTLVRRHGGRIWCESELGAGTTFTLTISQQ